VEVFHHQIIVGEGKGLRELSKCVGKGGGEPRVGDHPWISLLFVCLIFGGGTEGSSSSSASGE
jgi:hypothetical protein